MSFLTPFMLWGALAAGIPVAIHFFFRSRYRTVPWAAMKFLLTAVEQTSRRLKFQELLLLLLRMALLIVLAFAFARPISSAIKGTGRGEAVDAVFAFDLSYSMGANDGAKTRMERAKEQATKIIDELPPHSTVQIVTSSGKTRDNVGPRAPGNLDQARQIVKDLELTHLATNLAGGVVEAEDAFRRGQSSNKELYIFSDMQRQGFQTDVGKLKSTVLDLKEKTLVHMVRCGTKTLKNATIESIVPAAGVPRPGERVDFAVVVRNTGSEAMNNVRISLSVDEDEKKVKPGEPVKAADKELETTIIPKLAGGVSHAITLSVKLAKPGLSVLTARIDHDDLPGDNRFDQVILVRDQVNILVVDGQPNLQEPSLGSSYSLMHALLPVKETDRPTFKFNPRAISSGAASPADLKGTDICILANCSLQGLGKSTPLSPPFLDALDGFVREGHALLIFSGDNVKPDVYNRILGQKYGLLPTPLKKVVKADTAKQEMFFLNRDSFGKGPPGYWRFHEDGHYAILGATAVYQYIELDETSLQSGRPKKMKDGKEIPSNDAGYPQAILRLDNDKALIVTKKIDKGEVIFVGTASQGEGNDPKTGLPNWTEFNTGPRGLPGKMIPPLVPFMDVTVAHLIRGQTQTYNVTAGQALSWEPRDKVDHVYNLVHPDQVNATRLGLPERQERSEEQQDDDVKKKRSSLNLNRHRLSIADLPRAGVYRVLALPRGTDSSDTTDPIEAIKKGTPIAVVPDPAETEDLASMDNDAINKVFDFKPREDPPWLIHIVAGEEAPSTGEERLNREWTVWALLALLVLVLCEVVLAWWCGRSW